MNEKILCEAFCRDVAVRKVPRGWAVQTPFDSASGDALGFYLVCDSQNFYHVEDDGTSVAFLEAMGINLRSGTRAEAFNALLREYKISYDQQSGELRSRGVDESEIGAAALGFMAMMLRLQDFSLMHPVTVGTTFKEDARSAIEGRFSRIAEVRHEEAIGGKFENYVADAIVMVKGRQPVAIYYGTANDKVNEAVILWMEVHHVVRAGPQVVLLLETPQPRGITGRALARAHNYLDAIAVFRGEEASAVERIARCVDEAPSVLQ